MVAPPRLVPASKHVVDNLRVGNIRYVLYNNFSWPSVTRINSQLIFHHDHDGVTVIVANIHRYPNAAAAMRELKANKDILFEEPGTKPHGPVIVFEVRIAQKQYTGDQIAHLKRLTGAAENSSQRSKRIIPRVFGELEEGLLP